MNNNALNDFRFKDTNTGFARQQNPLRVSEYPCDVEYSEGMNLGACSFLILLDYPQDVEVYVALNPNRENAVKLDTRNTGFRIGDVFTEQGVQAMTNEAYLWTKGVTTFTEPDGTPARVKIATSGLTNFDVLTNSTVNAIDKIGQVGKINGGMLQKVVNSYVEIPKTAIERYASAVFTNKGYAKYDAYVLYNITKKDIEQWLITNRQIQVIYHLLVTARSFDSTGSAAYVSSMIGICAPLEVLTAQGAQGIVLTLTTGDKENPVFLFDAFTDTENVGNISQVSYHKDGTFQTCITSLIDIESDFYKNADMLDTIASIKFWLGSIQLRVPPDNESYAQTHIQIFQCSDDE